MATPNPAIPTESESVMSTHSVIAKDLGNGHVESVYCHFDGYLEGVGETLMLYYTHPYKVDALIGLGDLLSVGETNVKSFHDDDGEDWDDVKPQIVPLVNLIYYAKQERGAHYVYLFQDGNWLTPVKGQWQPIKSVFEERKELERLQAKYGN